MHKPIRIEKLSLELPHKTCFYDFSTQIHSGDRIGIIGKNGSGKSSLIKILLEQIEPSKGNVYNLSYLSIGYVPQTIVNHDDLSGGERFNRALSDALEMEPDILILDEPTNHLDQQTRYSLMRMLNNYRGTLVVATHDTNLINQCVNTIWHIDQGKINVFSGNYDDYKRECLICRNNQERTLELLKKEKKKIKEAKIKELKKSSKQGKSKPKDNEKLSYNGKASKGKATSDARVSALKSELENIQKDISDSRLPEILIPKFKLNSASVSLSKTVLSISQGSCGYENAPIVSGISLSMSGTDKISLSGNNASGKTTFLKAILGSKSVLRQGGWNVPNPQDIGYVDQHYENLSPTKTVEEIIYERSRLPHSEIRKHLNDFLFRKNEEVFEKVQNLSGGEKARLSLAQIAIAPPKLLILDEITNNVDIETKEYISAVLSNYPGAFIIISHEPDFLDSLPLTGKYLIEKGKFLLDRQKSSQLFHSFPNGRERS